MKLINDIRKFEREYGLKPADIQISPNSNQITVTIDKTVLYEYDQNQKSRFQRFFGWLNDNDNSFNEKNHEKTLWKALNGGIEEAVGPEGSAVSVSVKKRYKQLPVPYFSIPVPIENSGTKVRAYNNLATQKIKVSLTFPVSCESKEAITCLLKAAITSDKKKDGTDLHTAVRRTTWNPIKRFLHVLSQGIPDEMAKKWNRFLPNKWIKATRPNEWGSGMAQLEINQGFVNSGLLASIMNIPLSVLTGGLPAVIASSESSEDKEYKKTVQRNEYYSAPSDANYSSFGFFQTRSKLERVVCTLVKDLHGDPSYDEYYLPDSEQAIRSVVSRIR